MAKKNYYDLLNIDKSASESEIKKAYRELAKKYHPDRNPNDKNAEQKFKEITAAYEILGDKQKRAMYDQHGENAFQNGGFDQNNYAGFGGGNFNDVFSDIFGDIFGGGSRSTNKTRRGGDLSSQVVILLKEAYTGIKRNISFMAASSCKTCNATGSTSKAAPINCSGCNGAGVTRMQQGFFTVEKTCRQCGGEGRVIKDPCKECKGEGRVNRERTLAVTIPAGVETGTKIRLAGEGEAGFKGGEAGDLYIYVNVKEDNFFKVDGSNLRCKIPVKFITAVLGGVVEVPSIDGSIAKITIAEGTQNNAIFRLKDKGMTKLRSKERGDMYVTLNIEIPVNLTKKQKELLEEFDKENEKGNNPTSESFFDKVKNIWNNEGG